MQLPTVQLLLLVAVVTTTVDAFVSPAGWTMMKMKTTTTERYASSSSSVSEEDVLARAAECINDADSCSAKEIETLFERKKETTRSCCPLFWKQYSKTSLSFSLFLSLFLFPNKKVFVPWVNWRMVVGMSWVM